MGFEVMRQNRELERPGEAPRIGYGYRVWNDHISIDAVPFGTAEERALFEGSVGRLTSLEAADLVDVAGALAATRWGNTSYPEARQAPFDEVAGYLELEPEETWALSELVGEWNPAFGAPDAAELVERLAREADIALADERRYRVTLDVVYRPNGTSPDELTRLLQGLVERAIGDGALTGETPAEVESWNQSVEDVTPPSMLTTLAVGDPSRGR